MEESIIFSIIMPTYNSERTLERALQGIRRQNFDQSKIEILVVDGGSTDKTLKIAHKYRAIIVNNPDRLPEPAKLYGMQKATGKYICVMGSDEIMTKKSLLKERYIFLMKHPEVHGLLAELVAPKNYSPFCAYMNAVGDPFTCFVYKSYGNRFYNLRKNLYYKDKNAYIYKFSNEDIIPIGDGGTVLDMDYIRDKYADLMKTHETSVLWDVVIRDNGLVACLKGDYVIHLSSCDFRTYLKKLKFRVINNIHNIEGSGYAFRARSDRQLNKRKYLYPIYCILLPWPIWDGLQMALRMKHWIYLVHPFFCWYVMVQIIYQYGKKFLGYKSQNTTYGK